MLKYLGMVNMDFTTISMLKPKAGQLGGFSVDFLLILIKGIFKTCPQLYVWSLSAFPVKNVWRTRYNSLKWNILSINRHGQTYNPVLHEPGCLDSYISPMGQQSNPRKGS